ncbi:tyrosine-type recombinase/integrase [Pseudooceanicola sp.]|uniref:tyrosine-type recombinase/integrase n=1 Tax=Pseudooceanicola sp. TaxID=1914328 RepID=UPI0034366E17
MPAKSSETIPGSICPRRPFGSSTACARARLRSSPTPPDAITANFTRACKLLGIEELHFHDLRHEGISRLFEMGWNIPHVVAASGLRSRGLA